MKITKLGHCAMVVEHEGVKLLTDPGSFTAREQEAVTGLHGILITHEHQDHLHIDSLKVILANNPTATVVGNSAVAKIVGEQIADCSVVVVGDGQATDIGGMKIEGFGKDHALVYPPNMGLVENTGYFVGDKFYFPGDAFHNPGKQVAVLALPVAGPWMKISEAIDYAKEMKASAAFGVHDGMIQPFFRGFIYSLLNTIVPGTKFVEIKDGETKEF
jgi:L-ascorbate metabolism protein UlaG (beta-lactamase superfamily)